MVADAAEPASRRTADSVRGVERALARAQELVDNRPTEPRALSWYVEATQVGDLSLLALLLQRAKASSSPESEPLS
jgi:hypothetical protein